MRQHVHVIIITDIGVSAQYTGILCNGKKSLSEAQIVDILASTPFSESEGEDFGISSGDEFVPDTFHMNSDTEGEGANFDDISEPTSILSSQPVEGTTKIVRNTVIIQSRSIDLYFLQ